jgi:hypothetical protein
LIFGRTTPATVLNTKPRRGVHQQELNLSVPLL